MKDLMLDRKSLVSSKENQTRYRLHIKIKTASLNSKLFFCDLMFSHSRCQRFDS